MRTTIRIDTPVLEDVRRLSRAEGKPMGQVVSELLADALERRSEIAEAPAFAWTARSLGARVDFDDKAALWAALDEPTEP